MKYRVVELKTLRFSTAIGSNLYAEDRVEYFSVFLVAAISATVPASVIAKFYYTTGPDQKSPRTLSETRVCGPGLAKKSVRVCASPVGPV